MTDQNTPGDALTGHPPDGKPHCDHCGTYNTKLWMCCRFIQPNWGNIITTHYCSQACQRAEWRSVHYRGGGHYSDCTNPRDGSSFEAEKQQDLLDDMPEARQGRFGDPSCGCPACVCFCDECEACNPNYWK